MKVFAGGIATETNTFSPIPTGMGDFDIVRAADLVGGKEISGFGSLFNLLRGKTEERNWEFVFSLFAFAQPAGLTLRAVYESLRDEMLEALKEAMPVDMVLLFLHGAMVAEGYDDCETDILSRVRRIVGPDVKVGVELDLHCDITQAMLDDADAIVIFKEYPHTDIGDRALDLFNLVAATAEGKIKPTMALFDCRMIGAYPTTAEPMRSFVDSMLAMEGKDGVLSVSLAHCFPWGDVPTCGAQALAITDDDPFKATAVAKAVGRRFFDLRHQVSLKPLLLEEGLDKALSAEKGPVVVADQADNAGGGAPSDSTFVLRALMERGVSDTALGMIWDPIVVQLAMAAGTGARLKLRLGGKMGPMSGDPMDLSVTVTGLIKDMVQQWPQQDGTAMTIPCGDSAALYCDGIDIIVNSARSQVFSPQIFTNFGIEPLERKLLVVKSTQHFYAAFAPLASEVIYLAAPGAIAPLIKEIPYQRVDLNKYPWLDDPFAEQKPV
jgi:microcystin degradation protein MlrC